MELFVLILMLVIGCLCLYLGWRIWKKEEITLIHDYHYAKVRERDKKAYTEKMGKAMLLLGVGICMTGIICFVSHTGYGWLSFGICSILAFGKMISAQMRYNK